MEKLEQKMSADEEKVLSNKEIQEMGSVPVAELEKEIGEVTERDFERGKSNF